MQWAAAEQSLWQPWTLEWKVMRILDLVCLTSSECIPPVELVSLGFGPAEN